MKGTLVYNENTGDVKITQSKKGSIKWNKLERDNYKPICTVDGWNGSVYPLSKEK